MKHFCIHTLDADGQTWYCPERMADTPQAAVDLLLESNPRYRPENGRKLMAWSEWAGPLDYAELREEAIAKGRLIVDGKCIDPDAAHPSKLPFRIGGIYRQNDGALVRLDPPMKQWKEKDVAHAMFVGREIGNGMRHLSDGRYAKGYHYANLVPGELDEKGNPITPTATLVAAVKDLQQAAADSLLDRKMIERDGPARPAPIATPAPAAPTALPALPGLTRSPDLRHSTHLVEPQHGSAHLEGRR
jgi:hypothetical protein